MVFMFNSSHWMSVFLPNAFRRQCRTMSGATNFKVTLISLLATAFLQTDEVESFTNPFRLTTRQHYCTGIPCDWDTTAITPLRRCDETEFKCSNGKCIRRTWFCDGGNDCGDNSDERYCDYSYSCPTGWTRCPNTNRCILSSMVCDGYKDCNGISEERNCGTTTEKTTSNAPANTTIVTTPKNVTSKAGLASWFLSLRKAGPRTERWGSEVHRIAVSLHLADNSTFRPGNTTGEEIRNELKMQLLHRLSKDKRISSQELALYVHALLVTCMDPKDFYGDDLVLQLRRRVEEGGNYTNPFLILVLCNAGDAMTTKDVDRVTAAYDSQHRPFWTSTQAMASMALSCISSRSGLSVDKHILQDMLRELKRHQSKNGTVGNLQTTALVTQALFSNGSYKKDFNYTSAIKILKDGLNGNKSFLEAYYAIPVLHGKSLLNISSNHCSKRSVADLSLILEEEALQKVLATTGETMTVQYSVWMGEEINLARTWRLKVLVGSTIYDAIETVAKIDNRQKIKYNVVDGKPYVAALNGREDDTEMGMFWFIYLKTLGSDKDPKIVEESPVDIKLRPNQEIILWYKRGPWSDQSPKD